MNVFVSIVLALVASVATAAEPAGKTFSVQGSVSAQAPTAPVRTLEIKGPVFMQDAIRTAPDSKMQVLFADDTVFSQGPNMEVVIDEFVYDPVNTKNNAFKARVERGVFRTVSGKINDLNPDKFEIKTGRATIGIRGCGVSARLDDRRDEITIDYVRTGRVVVVTPFGGKPMEFREPGLVVIENGGRVRKQRFDPARFVMNLGDTTPNDTGRKTGPDSAPGGGFKRDADVIQEELVTLTQPPAPAPSPQPPPDDPDPPPPPPPPPWPVIQGQFDGFAMNQWDSILNINPLDVEAMDPLHATANFNMIVDSEQASPIQAGGTLYGVPLSVMIMPGYPVQAFGLGDPNATVTGTRLTAETFQALLTGPNYDITMIIQRGSPESDWYKAWWGMDKKDTPARMRDGQLLPWKACQGFAVLGNTFTAAETADLKNGATSFLLVQDGAGWAAGLGHYQWYSPAGPAESQNFTLSGAPVGTEVRIGGGQDSWSTQLQLQHTGVSATPVQCDVSVQGTLLDNDSKFTATVTPTVNTLMINGRDFQGPPNRTYAATRLVGSKLPGAQPSGLIGSVTVSGGTYSPTGSGSYEMNLHFGTDLKPRSAVLSH